MGVVVFIVVISAGDPDLFSSLWVLSPGNRPDEAPQKAPPATVEGRYQTLLTLYSYLRADSPSGPAKSYLPKGGVKKVWGSRDK